MEELRLKLISDCNASGLPLEAILFVVRDVYRDAQESYQKYTEQQKAASMIKAADEVETSEE